jgi:hypothetical protein
MARTIHVLAVIGALALAPGTRAAELGFPVPAGWLDVSPTAPDENFARLPAELARTLRGGSFRVFAFDLAHASNGFTPSLNVVAIPRTLRVTSSNREEAVREVFAGLQQEIPTARLVESGILSVSGVNALRMVYDSDVGGRALRQMALVVPGKPQSAVVTYAALRTQFDALRPAFEAHAASITGAEEDGVLAAAVRGGARSAVGGAIVALGLGVLGLLWARRRGT